MYILKYAQKDQAFREASEKLQSLSLGHKTTYQVRLKEVSLFDDRELVASGLPAILEHLDQVSGELGQWYYCSC